MCLEHLKTSMQESEQPKDLNGRILQELVKLKGYQHDQRCKRFEEETEKGWTEVRKRLKIEHDAGTQQSSYS